MTWNWTKITPAQLAATRAGRAEYLRRQLAAVPPITAADYDGSRRAFDDAMAALRRRIEDLPEDPPARITERWDGASVAMLGIRATSTSGLNGALRNWCAAADKRAQENA